MTDDRSTPGLTPVLCIIIASLLIIVARRHDDVSPDALPPGHATTIRHTIDIATATVHELDLLPGIGPARAALIVDARSSNALREVDDLLAVRGIGPVTLTRLRPWCRFSGQSDSANAP